jgi:DNA polymerase alpha subunit A
MERGRRSAAKVKPHPGFAELKRLREEGKTRLSVYQVEREEDLYEEVSEDEYKKVVRKRLDEDDFVVDDGGEGYVDNGMDDWGDEERRYMSEDDEAEEDGRKLSKKELKRKREEDKERKDRQEGALHKYFNKASTAAPTKQKATATTVQDKEFLEDLLGEFDISAGGRAGSPMKKVKTGLAKMPRKLSPPRKKFQTAPMRSSPPPIDNDSDYGDDIPLVPEMDDDDAHMSDAPGIPPSSPAAKAADRKLPKFEDDDDDDFVVAEIKGNKSIHAAKVNLTSFRPAAAPLPAPSTSSPTKAPTTIDSSAWTEVSGGLNVVASTADGVSFGKVSHKDAVEEDGSIKMFWLDYTEVNGSLVLFGKVRDKRSGKYVSAFLKVDGIMRNLFFLPREHRVRSGRETDEEVQMSEVHEEISSIMETHKFDGFKAKPTTRRYAFELPDVPREGDYLKVLYPYTSE